MLNRSRSTPHFFRAVFCASVVEAERHLSTATLSICCSLARQGGPSGKGTRSQNIKTTGIFKAQRLICCRKRCPLDRTRQSRFSRTSWSDILLNQPRFVFGYMSHELQRVVRKCKHCFDRPTATNVTRPRKICCWARFWRSTGTLEKSAVRFVVFFVLPEISSICHIIVDISIFERHKGYHRKQSRYAPATTFMNFGDLQR